MSFDWTGAIERARHHSPFLAAAMDRMPEITALLRAGDGETALSLARDAGTDAANVGVALRRERLATALCLAIGDLAGAFSVSRVTGELSELADRALDAAIQDAIVRRVPDAEPAGFFALALGKHGARELNYSSDIDPILLYDPQTLPRRERDEPAEAAQRIARTLVETLGQFTDEGYVFRVDLRLRPASEVSPLAISVDAALSHYESSALAWERAAFIRARACSGDIAAGEQFLAAIRPFIWRKSLDFGAIAQIGRLTAQIRTHHDGTGKVEPGFDLKRGRGGIREVEFYAQTHQLIHGGRHPELRVRGTRESLDALAQGGFIGLDDARLLGEAYDRLRIFEHRLQMVHDRQTHSLPTDCAALDSVARLHGLADGAALIAELEQVTHTVGERYDALIADSITGPSSPTLPSDSKALAGELHRMGFADPDAAARRISSWGSGKLRTLRSDAARSAFDAIQPDLLAAIAGAPDPEGALVRWERLLGQLPSAINLFNLLEARPGLLEMLARILSLAPPLADELTRRADLLDPLLDASALELPGDVEALVADFSRRERGDAYEDVLDTVRRKVSELRFALGVQLIEGANDPLDIGAALARVAEAAICVLADAAVAEFREAHGRIADSELVILGLGRMGGGVLTHASDLDLVFLFTGDFHGDSDGRRPLGATLYYNRLGQRVIAALSVPTSEGALYEIDNRLRPSGEQGPLSANFESFELYQRKQAWAWEHMALTRARALYGSSGARQELDRIILSVLQTPREAEKLRDDILEMRTTMAQHKQPKGPLDVKLRRGGLVDLEFLVHYLQLRDKKSLAPDLREAIHGLADAGLLPEELIAAHDTMTRFLVASRLLAPDTQLPSPAACQALAKACGCGDWDEVEPKLEAANRAVARAWKDAFGANLEMTA